MYSWSLSAADFLVILPPVPGGDRKGRQTDKAGEEDMQRENTRELWRGGEGVKGGSSESR